MKKVAWISTHPIQYYSPMYKIFAESNELDFISYYFSDFSIKGYVDKEFNKEIKWDIPLLDGYKYKFIKNYSPKKSHGSFFSYINFGLFSEIKKNKFDLVVIHGWSTLSHLLAIITCKITKTPYALRGDTNSSNINRNFSIKNKLRHLFLSNIFNDASVIFNIGEQNKEFYKSFGVDDSKFIKMPFSINNDYFKSYTINKNELKIKYDIKENQKVLLFTGKLIEKKKPLLLLEALKDIDNSRYKLLIVGDGILLKECKKFVRDNDINCEFLGFINQKYIPLYYHLSDVYIMPSSYEPWGLAINEAMNCNCAIIASDVVGASNDLVKNNGYIFKSNSSDALRKCILELLENNDTLKEFKVNSLEIINNYSYSHDLISLKKFFNK